MENPENLLDLKYVSRDGDSAGGSLRSRDEQKGAKKRKASQIVVGVMFRFMAEIIQEG